MICSSCRLDKPVDAFGLHPLTRSGRQSQCRSCAAEGARRRRQAVMRRLAHDVETIRLHAVDHPGVWTPYQPDARMARALAVLVRRDLLELDADNRFRLKRA